MPKSAGFLRALESAENAITLEGTGGNDPSKPDFQAASYRRQIEDVLFCRVVYGGTKTARATTNELLPAHPAEESDDYQRRLDRAVLFNALKRTVGGLVGMLFRKDPIMGEDMPETLVEHAENIDLAGHTVAEFLARAQEDAIIDGHVWLFVEAPPADPDAVSEEDVQGKRPYWIAIKKAQAINPQWEIRDGRPRLTLFAYVTTFARSVAPFGEEVVEQIRVLRPGTWEVWEKTKTGWTPTESGTTTLDEIPVVFMPANETRAFESTPPLLDLAYENVDHYQIRSDHRHAAMFASAPMPVFFGTSEEGIIWGSNRSLFIDDAEASAMMLESSGASLDSTRQDMKDGEARMAALGLQMLVRETRAAETAEAKTLDKSESDSALTRVAKATQGAASEAWRLHAAYMAGTEPGTMTVNTDFRDVLLSPEMVDKLSSMVDKGQLSLGTMWSRLQIGEVLPEDLDHDEELAAIEAEGFSEGGLSREPLPPLAVPVADE